MEPSWHGAYLEVYERLLSPLKNTTDPVLEIGVLGGGFTLALSDFFKNSHVMAIDIGPFPEALTGKSGITFHQKNAYLKTTVDSLASPFAAIIEDGSHFLTDQEFFVRNYPLLLSECGIAIVEDIQELGHVQHLAKLVPSGFFSMGIDVRHIGDRYDNLLLAIWRK